MALVAAALGVDLPCSAQRPNATERRERLFKSWDKNGDGVLTEQEVPERFQPVVQAAAKRLGVSASEGVAIDNLIGRRRADANQSSGPGKPAAEASHKTPRSTVKGFDTKPNRAPPKGFGTANASDTNAAKPSAASASDQRTRRFATGLIKRYDGNKNGQLEKDEWKSIPGDASKRDGNGDGIITLDEMTAWVTNYQSNSRQSGSRKSRSSATKKPTPRKKPAKSGNADDGERASYRFVPANERLPDGLPSWFRQRDADGDGQVAMHEYGSRWSDRQVRDFERYDKNADGFISPNEAKKR